MISTSHITETIASSSAKPLLRLWPRRPGVEAELEVEVERIRSSVVLTRKAWQAADQTSEADAPTSYGTHIEAWPTRDLTPLRERTMSRPTTGFVASELSH